MIILLWKNEKVNKNDLHYKNSYVSVCARYGFMCIRVNVHAQEESEKGLGSAGVTTH